MMTMMNELELGNCDSKSFKGFWGVFFENMGTRY